MKSFRHYIKEQALLLEDRINKIKEIFKGKLNTSHDSLAKHKDSDTIVDHFSTHADPTSNKAHTQWIVSKYKKGDFRQEDHSRIKKALAAFEMHKAKLVKKDINQYKSLSDVEDAVEPHLASPAPVSKKEEKRQIKSTGADLIHDDKELGVTVHHLKTEDAACHYGAGTRWCTAARENNAFDEYNKKGPIHLIQHKGRKYQFHNASGQFMDEKDKKVEFKNMHPDIEKSLSKSDNTEIQKSLITGKSSHVQPHHIDNILELKGKEHASIKMIALEHPTAVQTHHIDKAMKDENLKIARKALEHPTAVQPHHIDKALEDSRDIVRGTAIWHSTAVQPHHIDKALEDNNIFVKIRALRNPATRARHVAKALKSPHGSIRYEANLRKGKVPD